MNSHSDLAPQAETRGEASPVLDDRSAHVDAKHHIEVEDLVVQYGDVVAVDGISFTVRRGEHLTLLGPSGCGKTTTLRAIAGLEKPTSGEIRIDGKPVFSSIKRVNVPTEKRELSMVFQSYAIWPHMSVFNNVVYGLRVRKKRGEELKRLGMEALALVRMEKYADRRASMLSGGQQQRVALARAVAFEPRVMLFDEPLSNLDANLRAEMRMEISSLQQRVGVTALYVTHDQEEALSISDRILVMNEGKIVQLGTPEEIYDAPVNGFLADFVGSANLIKGTIDASTESPGYYILTTEHGAKVCCQAPYGKPGRLATVSVRTVYLQLARTAPSDDVNVWPVTVRKRVFSGDFIEYFVDWSGDEAIVRRPPTEKFDEGEQVYMWTDPQWCVVLAN